MSGDRNRSQGFAVQIKHQVRVGQTGLAVTQLAQCIASARLGGVDDSSGHSRGNMWCGSGWKQRERPGRTEPCRRFAATMNARSTGAPGKSQKRRDEEKKAAGTSYDGDYAGRRAGGSAPCLRVLQASCGRMNRKWGLCPKGSSICHGSNCSRSPCLSFGAM